MLNIQHMNFLTDLRCACRRLSRSPAIPIVILFTLALGIGATTAMFQLVQAVLVDSLPFGEPDRLVMVWERRPSQGRESNPVSPADFFDWRSQASGFDGLAAHAFAGLNLTGEGDPERLEAARVTGGYFDVLGSHRSSVGAFCPRRRLRDESESSSSLTDSGSVGSARIQPFSKRSSL